MNRCFAVAIALTTALFAARVPSAGQPVLGKNKAVVDLVSSVEAIVPGQPFDLALRFRITEGWHIYWQNSGDSGQPPRVTWTLPAGFSAGDLQFPIPKRHLDPGNIKTNVLRYEPVLLVRMVPPQTVFENSVTLVGNVNYLVCEKLCLQEKASVTVELPVLPAGSEPRPANRELFEAARAALPKDSSKYVSIAPAASARELSPGEPFELILNIEVSRGHHIQSNTPSNPAFIKCDVFLERTPGVSICDHGYTPANKRKGQ